MELTYHTEIIEGGLEIQVPDLEMDPQPEESLRKYGMMREDWMKVHRKTDYTTMSLLGSLKSHLIQVQTEAEQRLEELEQQMAKEEGVTEALKATDQMAWVRKMNNIRQRAEEIVLAEIVHQ